MLIVIDLHKTSEMDYCRIIRFNDNEQPKLKSNRVITAKYGVLSFLPLFFIEQFRHFPNQYYTFISILQVSIKIIYFQRKI